MVLTVQVRTFGYDSLSRLTSAGNLEAGAVTYVYTWNNPLRYTDPTGKTVYVIAYTVGNESGDEEFKRVAQKRANEIRNAKGFDSKKDTVLLNGIKSFSDL